MIKVCIHVKDHRFESNRDVKYPRIPKEGGVGRINRFNFTVLFYKCCRFTEPPKEPGTFRRRVIMPEVQLTIFVNKNFNPQSIFIVQIFKNMSGHKRMFGNKQIPNT